MDACDNFHRTERPGYPLGHTASEECQPLEPSAIGSAQWREIGDLLTSLWVVVLLIVVFAANILIGHNFIPSLVASSHLPRSVQKTRPAFYALAILAFALAMFFLSRVVDLAGVLRDFWPDYWI